MGACVEAAQGNVGCSSEEALERYEAKHNGVCVRDSRYPMGLQGRGIYACKPR